MLDKDNIEIFKDAIETYGAEVQIDMVFEECSELIDALCKWKRGRSSIQDIVTEMADVSIMIDQLKVMFEVDDAFENERVKKIEKLTKRLKEHKNK